MEAIATLGFACNVIQLVGTSPEVTGIFKQAYRHADINDQETRARRFKNLSDAVDELQRIMQRPLRKDDSELNDIAEKCLESTKQLQAILKSLIPSSS